ncbi:MAG TPA: hypothetical protein VEJ63_13870 [Planctomycetota bacterium]|nr:hypothetical protein [Planctomycetota bacterium]
MVPDYADAGGASIFIPGGSQIRMTPATGLRRDWSAHDHVRLEVVNPSDKKEHIYIQIRDSENAHGYWSWHNRFEQLAPGKNILQIPTAEVWRGENLRRNPQGNLNTKDVQALCISAVKQDLFITDMQLAAKSDSTNHLDGKAEE